MNLPNLLTLVRMALVPVFIVFYYIAVGGAAGAQACAVLAFIVFVGASLTDMVDGQIARKRNLITNFGKLMDPLADKVLTAAAFVCFVDTGEVASWMVIVILAREFAITGLRSVAASEGKVIPAGPLGKIKTVLQMVAVSLILLKNTLGTEPEVGTPWTVVAYLALICLWAAVIATIVSGVDYLWKGREFLKLK